MQTALISNLHGADPVTCDIASLLLLELGRRVARGECTVLIARVTELWSERCYL